jgi:hypothetical protein
MARFFAVALLAVALAPPTLCQSSKDSSDLVYGKDWAFAVAEPAGWRLTWKNAEQWGANAILYRDAHGLRDGKDLIRITVASKVDEDSEKDLQSDMKAYSEQYPGAVFTDLSVSHPTYRVLSKLFQVRGESYEYVTYLNPGPEFRHVLSIAFNKQGSPASKQELSTFREVAASLRMVR